MVVAAVEFSVSVRSPAAARLPDQPSPASPPLGVHSLAPDALQVRVRGSPYTCAPAEAPRETATAGALGVVRVPVFCGSRTDLIVVLPVALVLSLTEFHTAASAVKSATPLLPLGAWGGEAGQDW